MYRLVAPRVKEGPGWAALATSERRSLAVDETVKLSTGTVVSLVNDEPEILKRKPLFSKACRMTSRWASAEGAEIFLVGRTLNPVTCQNA